MKKLFLISILILSSIICFGQAQQYSRIKKFVPDPTIIQTINITPNPYINGWGLDGDPCAGCPSFFSAILRSQELHMAEDGMYYYYFYIFFNSNSHYTNGNKAATYLENVSFIEDGKTVFMAPYILVIPNEAGYKAWIRSTNPYAMVTFNVQNYRVQ